jgi:hypothetical protein
VEKQINVGKNKEIVDGKLTSYVFLSLYYCPNQQFSARVKKLYQIVQNEKLELKSGSAKQRLVLGMFKFRVHRLLYVYIKIERCLRKGIRRLRNG